MKKLFTFLMALAMTTVVFGQLNSIQPKPTRTVDFPESTDRSNWYGPTSSTFNEFEQGDILITRLNSFMTPVAGTQITKIQFKWIESYGEGQDQTIYDPEFNVKIYTGGNINWIVPVATNDDFDNAVWYTSDASAMGTEVYSQAYTAQATDDGLQTVELTTPYNITGNEGEIWIALEVLGTKTSCFINTDAEPGTEWGCGLTRQVVNGTTYLQVPVYYYNTAHTLLTAAKYVIRAYVEDGQAYQPQSDWMAEIYDPEDEATYPEAIDWMQISEYDDAINFYGGFYNMGVDTSYGFYFVELYAQVEGGEPVYFINENWNDEPTGVEVYSGWRPQGELITVDSLEYYNLSYPFQLCLSVTYNSDPTYNGVDPNLSNNTACITVSNEPAPINIKENNNTLTVSPNPASTILTVENAAGAQISVYNIAGQEVMSVENAEANETLNVSNLNAGLYIVRVVNGNEVSTAKVSIVR